MNGTNSKVICWRTAAAHERKSAPGQIWDRLEREGWLALPGHQPHVVIQVGQAARSPAVIATGRSLASRLAKLAPGTRIEVLDQAAAPGDWGALAVRHIVSEERLRVRAVSVPQGLVLPQLWFESFVLITVTEASSSATSRIASVLAAQAEPLSQLRNIGVPAAFIYEAHRLAASDLAIVCGTMHPSHGASGNFWAASTSDTALEQAILAAGGITPEDSAPHFQELLRHELPPPSPRVEGDLPTLRHLTAPAWEIRREVLTSKVRNSSHVFAQDMRTLQGNLHKIPAFVRRRVATWRSQRSGR